MLREAKTTTRKGLSSDRACSWPTSMMPTLSCMRLLMLLLKSTQSSPEMCKASWVMAVMAKLKVQIVMKT